MFWTAALACLAGAAWTCSTVWADDPPAADFQPNEAVEVIQVRLDVGADGEDLKEPVALDLGLGFPFWLHPAGRGEGQTAPFGAVPQETTAAATVPAGSSATFTFRLAAEPGQDVFQTTPQLLSGVQVSDIARVGFSSRGATNWALAGYEVTVNGKRLAASETVNRKAREAQNAAQSRLAGLGAQIGPKQAELADLKALVQTGLATEAEQGRVAVLDAELQPLLLEKRRLERQVQGEYPWLEDADFRPIGRNGSLVSSAKVTVLTQLHTAADTQNYVYFRTGGRKYLLGSHERPFSSEAGPQSFDLDLLAGPLTTGDLRGYALGMLGNAYPYGPAPDRWHPQRLLIEIDGRIVYDSDENPLDRNSLEAIRLVPPVHVDGTTLVSNTPIARETYVWEAGEGLGLDLASGSALDLPDPTDPAFPEAEPGTDAAAENTADKSAENPDDTGSEEDLGAEFFPGEEEWAGGGGEDFGGGAGGGGGGGNPGPWDWPADDLFDLPDGVEPDPAGEPVQVTNVRIAQGSRIDDEFVITWDATGDESTVHHYEVYLVPVVPQDSPPYEFLDRVLIAPNAPPRSGATNPTRLSADQIAQVAPDDLRRQELFLAPYVVAVPVDPAADNAFSDPGPAKAILPAGAGAVPAPGQWMTWTADLNGNGVPDAGELTPLEDVQLAEPAAAGGAVWIAGEEASHNAILFDDHLPGAMNVGFRPVPGNHGLLLLLRKEVIGPVAPRRIVAHVGFRDRDAASAVTVQLKCQLFNALGMPVGGPGNFGPVPLAVAAGGEPTPMAHLNLLWDPGVAGVGNYQMRMVFVVTGGDADAMAHPPILFGVRVLDE